MLEIPALAPAVAALGAFLIGSQSKWQMNPNGPDETAEHAACAKGKSRDSFTQRVRRTASNAASRALFSRGSRISRFTPTAFSRIKELLAGVLFGIAFQIKLVNVILLPLAALIVWLRQQETGFSHGPNRPTPDPSQEGNNSSSPSRPLPSSGGAVGGFMNETAKLRPGTAGMALPCSGRLDSSLSPPRSAVERVSGGRATLHFGSAGKMVMAMVPLAWLSLTLIAFATHKPWWSCDSSGLKFEVESARKGNSYPPVRKRDGDF